MMVMTKLDRKVIAKCVWKYMEGRVESTRKGEEREGYHTYNFEQNNEYYTHFFIQFIYI